MRISRVVVLVLVVIILLIVAVYAFSVLLAPKESSSAWQAAAGYPVQLDGTYAIAGQQCVNSTLYVYCIGGQDANQGPRSEVYVSSVVSPASANITGWTPSSPYRQVINGQSCVVYSGYVYCVGGSYDSSPDDTASSYYASLGEGSVANWLNTTAYPIPIDTLSCVASTGYVYCVGGVNETDGTAADSTTSSSVWYAQLSPSGIGAWTHSTSYPANVYYPSCYAANGYIYCLGGADSNGNSLNADYYASLSAAGVGTWTATQSYPISLTGQACAISSGYIFCVGGETAGGSSPSYTNAVYYASVSASGIGPWKQAGVYPVSVGTTCVVSSGYMYCVGGFDESSVGENNAVYYASLNSLLSTTASG